MNQRLKHYLTLIGILILGTALRFWHLDLKPLWLDEVITALITLGRSYNDVPLNVVLPLSELQKIFTFNSAATCSDISYTLATQSTHPPLFFCLMHSWLKLLVGNNFVPLQSWVWLVRSLPALFGVAAIAAIYLLNRIAFSPTAGLMAAALMAVSPFGVYLSQEARHYTLPILVITLSLLGLILIQQDLYKGKNLQLFIWLYWTTINSIGFYIHYFFILAFLAELPSLYWLIYKFKIKGKSLQYQTKSLLLTTTYTILPFALFLPWLFVLAGHVRSSETGWLPSPQNIAPIYQTLAGWLLMVIALPVENQPLWLAIPIVILMLAFGAWLGRCVFKSIKQIKKQSDIYISILTLGIFIFSVLLEFIVIIYLLRKDITVAPRYHFIYYPAVCAILAACLSYKKVNYNSYQTLTRASLIVLLVGFISCIFVTSDLAFKKTYNPQQVAQNIMAWQPNVPNLVVMAYENSQDVALGLSYALALDNIKTANFEKNTNTYFTFVNRSLGYASVWRRVSQFQELLFPLNLWIIAPKIKKQNYPQQLNLSGKVTCVINPSHYYRSGLPHQLYQCGLGNKEQHYSKGQK